VGRTNIKQVRAIAAVSAAGWDPIALKTKQLNDQDTGPTIEEVETGQRLASKDIPNEVPHTKATWHNVHPPLWRTAY
jgi:hypothetical protein